MKKYGTWAIVAVVGILVYKKVDGVRNFLDGIFGKIGM